MCIIYHKESLDIEEMEKYNTEGLVDRGQIVLSVITNWLCL